MRSVRAVLRSVGLGASTLVLIGVLGILSAPAIASESRQNLFTASVGPTILKRLPAGRDELIFHGEATSRTWSMVLSASEAAHAATFQFGLLNSVVVLPERSSLKLAINGRPIAVIPVESTDKTTPYSFKIPTGLLMPGHNKVQISVAMTHRVDCSINATYELWASLDPTQTGIKLEGAGTFAVRSLEELAAEPLSEDGTTHIHLRMADNPDAAAINRAARVVEAVVSRAGVFRPVVDVGHDIGQGPGFDILVDDDAASFPDQSLKILGRQGRIIFGRDPATDRLVLVVGANETNIDAVIAELERSPSKAQSLPSTAVTLEADGYRSFAELGLSTENFSGRHYLSSANIALPADFFPANDDVVHVNLEGFHSNTLDDAGEIIFRVNGALASSLRLQSGREERFNHRTINLPMHFFHPGQNEISIEGITSSIFDQQCDALASAHEPRLTIGGNSEIVFPRFARLTTEPQISTTLAGAQDSRERVSHLYLADSDRATLGAALTTLANMALAGNTSSPFIHSGLPADGDFPGIVIAPIDELPPMLATAVRRLTSNGSTDETGVGSLSTPSDSTDSSESRSLQSSGAPDDFASYFSGALNNAKISLTWLGASLSSAKERVATLPLTNASMLVAAVEPTHEKRSYAGINLPRFASKPDQWLVITGLTPDSYTGGVERLASSGRWALLGGEASTFDLKTGDLRSIEPTEVSYVVPSDLKLSEIRPVLGGILSENMLVGIVAWFLVIIVLGVSTHALISRAGVR
jgi:cellulose synthase operon protein B